MNEAGGLGVSTQPERTRLQLPCGLGGADWEGRQVVNRIFLCPLGPEATRGSERSRLG